MGKKFEKLERKIESEYEKKGKPKKTAEKWARATAGEVFREKECVHCGRKGHHPDACAYRPSIHHLM